MASGGGALSAWQGEERARREAKAARKLGRDAWKLAGRRWHGEAVLHGGGRRGRAEELEEGEKGRFEISKISRDLNVKQG